MQTVIFTQGLPGSGKSTFAKKHCEDNTMFIRVSRDDLRNMRGRYWLPKQEDLITSMEQACIVSAIRKGYNVVVDATNFNETYINTLKTVILWETTEVNFEIKSFTDVPVEECIRRDLKRPNSVGEKVIRDMYNKYVRPSYVVDNDLSLPPAIISDIDGTVAIHNGRSPYDMDKCDTDIVNEKLRNILWSTTGTWNHLIFVTGREEKYREKTYAWLIKNIPNRHFDLYMRPTGDNREDSIVKRELFFKHINGKYRIEAVFDDRKRVCRMWHHDLKLPLFRVGDPDADF